MREGSPAGHGWPAEWARTDIRTSAAGRKQAEEKGLGQLAQMHELGALVLGVSITSSLDELAIGFPLGLLHLPTAFVLAFIGLQAFIVTQLGLRLGSSERLREGAERLPGAALTGLDAVLLAEKQIP